MSDDVHAKLKLKTVKENTSIQDVIERFIKFYVSSDEPVNINFKTTESVEKIHSDNDNRVLKIDVNKADYKPKTTDEIYEIINKGINQIVEQIVSDNKNEKKESRGFFTAIYTVAAIFLIMAFAFSVLKVSNHPQENANNDVVEDSAPVDKSNVAPLTTTEATTLEETTTEATTKHMDVVQPKTAAIFDDTQEMEYPIADAKILMDYSTETAVYDNTLDQYRTNDSIAFAATLGENVVAAFDGVVTSVDKDDINGTTVTIDNGNGWSTTYSQLKDNLQVAQGQTVYKGDIIGIVAEPTKYSTNLGPHLDFAVFKDDESVDPKTVLASAED